MHIRPETAADRPMIASLTTEAFRRAPHSQGNEAAIIEALRRDGDLALSLVCEIAGTVVGHIAFSKVAIGGEDLNWYGLGPLAVSPKWQRHGIAGAMVREGISLIKALGAQGCVVLGDPQYYARFGFEPDRGLTLAGVPAAYFQALPFNDITPEGEVTYPPAFAE